MEPRPSILRVLAAGLSATLAATLAILLLRAVAIPLLRVDAGFTPIQSPNAMIATFVAGVGATILLALLVRASERPIDRFLRASAIVFNLSLLPPLLLLIAQGPYPGTSAATVLALLVMHAVAAGIVVGLTLAIVTQDSPFHTHQGHVAH